VYFVIVRAVSVALAKICTNIPHEGKKIIKLPKVGKTPGNSACISN